MPQTIKSGSSGNVVKVDGNNRLHAQTVSVPEEWNANKNGDAYNVNTGIITLTDSVDTPILYMKNSNSRAIHVSAIAVGVGPSTGGSGGIPKITVVRNPTSLSTSNDVDINSNRNYGSNNTLTSVVAYKGATGDTLTGGTDHLLFFQTSGGRLYATIDEYIPTGSSIAVKFDPQPSNTSQDVYCALICHFADDDNED